MDFLNIIIFNLNIYKYKQFLKIIKINSKKFINEKNLIRKRNILTLIIIIINCFARINRIRVIL